MTLPLSGVLVVSLEQAVAAPMCSCRLADAGARVIKIERPEGDFARGYDNLVHGECGYFIWLNRGKESIVLDLAKDADKALLAAMIARADVFVQNLKPGAVGKLGFAIAELRRKHPRLICCSISGFGENGPLAKRKAYDMLIQAESGLASITGTTEPSRVGVSVVDIAAGMNAYEAILEALIARERTGEGAALSISMFDAMADWMTVPLLQQEAGAPPRRIGLAHTSISPYGAFRSRDGVDILISIQSDREWRVLAETVLGDAALAADPNFATNVERVKRRPETDGRVAKIFAAQDAEALEQKLAVADIAFARVNSPADLARHPHLRRITVGTPSGPVSYPRRHETMPAKPDATARCLRSASTPKKYARSLWAPPLRYPDIAAGLVPARDVFIFARPDTGRHERPNPILEAIRKANSGRIGVMDIGFIGLGNMGAHMARRLVEAGHKVVVYDTRQEAIGDLAARGAVAARSPKEVADTVETVMVSLPTPDIVLKVATGPDGVIEGKRVKRFVDLSTTGAVMAQRIFKALAARNIVQIDAPVSGGVRGAEKGTVAVMASGPRADVEAVEPALKVIGKFFYIGERPGAGQTMKLCNNVLSAAAMAATSESMVTGVKAGLDPRIMLDVINASSGRSTATEQKFPEVVLPRTFNQGFTAGLMLKDVNLFISEAKALGIPIQVIEAVAAILKLACDELGPDKDITQIVQPLEQRAGVEVRAPKA